VDLALIMRHRLSSSTHPRARLRAVAL